MKRCKTCLLPDTYPDISFNDHNICNFCVSNSHQADDPVEQRKLLQKKNHLKEEFEAYIKQIKGTADYDCVVLFSGGKDSIYLLYLLKEKYHLRPLAVTVDNDFLSPRVHLNIKNAIQLLHVDHRFVKPAHGFFKRLYRQYLLYPEEKTYCDSICDICQMVILSIGLNLAAEQHIPFVALAYSPDQARYFERPKADLMKSWVPHTLDTAEFTDDDKQYFWDPDRYDHHPRMFLPFYALEYPGIGNIMKLLAEKGFGKKINLDPIRTSCKMQWVIMQLDLLKFGYNPYAWDTCSLVRMGKANRDMWYLVLTFGTWLLKNGLVRNMDRKKVLDSLELDIRSILKKN